MEDYEHMPPVRAFGEWDAPMTDDAEWLDEVPPGLTCMTCREPIRQGENGAIMPTGFATHRECSLRGAMGGIGHLVDHARFCGKDPDAGLSTRTSALLVWRWFHGERFTPQDLDELRASVDV